MHLQPSSTLSLVRCLQLAANDQHGLDIATIEIPCQLPTACAPTGAYANGLKNLSFQRVLHHGWIPGFRFARFFSSPERDGMDPAGLPWATSAAELLKAIHRGKLLLHVAPILGIGKGILEVDPVMSGSDLLGEEGPMVREVYLPTLELSITFLGLTLSVYTKCTEA